MKAVIVLLVIFTFQAFAQEFLECIARGIAPVFDDAEVDREELQVWSQDLSATAQRLQSQRQRCKDLPRDDPPTALQDRIIQACTAAWTASAVCELNRVYNDLLAIDPELAAALREHSAECFPSLPGSRRFFANMQ